MNLQVTPAALTDAATSLAAIGSNLTEANTLAALPTTSILPAAADEVSAFISELFGAHGEFWQALAAQAAALHQEFVNLMNQAANEYSLVELGIAETLREPAFTYSPAMGIEILPGVFNQPVGQGLDLFHLDWGGIL